MVQAKLSNYITQDENTAVTVANQQYYNYPLGIMNIENVVITVGNVRYPLTVINNQYNWNILNAIQIQASAIPQFIFPRSPYLSAENGGGYGIWPIPQDEYTITFYKHYRNRDLNIADYDTGTISVTADDGTVTGSGTTFTAAMVGRFLQVTSASSPGQGYWYLVSEYTSATSLEIVPVWAAATASGLSYRIGQVPTIPDEGHIILCDGATADYYAGLRKDKDANIWWENRFWTGDGNNTNREEGTGKIAGGLLGLVTRYSDRNNERLIQRKPKLSPLNYQVWATELS